MSALATVAAALLVAAPEVPPPSSPGLEGAPVRVERRLLLKSGRFFLTGGADWFLRGDYYVSPGLLASASYWTSELEGVEMRLGVFFSFLGPAADQVFRSVGVVPDAQRPVVLLVAGYRRSVGYGKAMLAGTPESLVHFDLQLAAHGGLLFTHKMPSPAVSVAPALLARLPSGWFVQMDVELYASIEIRQAGWLALGLLPIVTAGVVL